jgi:chromosome segregation ATPase
VAFRFFSKSTSSYIAPAGIAPGLQSRPVIQSPLDTPESVAPAAELDTLSVFFPEDNSSISAPARVRITENLQAASRYTDANVQNTSAALEIEAKRLDDFRKLFRQTQQAVAQLKGDASAIRGDLHELRSLGDHLNQGYTRLGDICRLTEKRSELTVDVLNGIEKRIEPLEVVRELTATTEESFASLKQLAEEVMQCGTRFEAQKEAIDRACEEATRVGRLMEDQQSRVALLTEKSEWLGEAEATVGRLEHRAVETTGQLDRRVNDLNTQKQTIEQALAEATRVTAILSALENRIASLTGGDLGLGHAGDTIELLEQRAAQTTARLDRRVSDFDAQRQTIEEAAIQAARITSILGALEARVTALAGGDQGLGHAAETVSQLEQRATATMAELERRLEGFDGRKRAIEWALVAACTQSDETLRQAEETVGWLEQRAAETTAQFERRVSHFDRQKHTIEQALVTALTEGDQRLAQAEETVRRLEHHGVETAAQLEQRVRHFDAEKQTIAQELVEAVTGSDRELRRAEETAGRLEQRAAASMDQLERSIDHFDAQKSTIERAAAEATRVTGVLSALEARAAALIGSDRALGQAETAIGQLEQRTAEARVQVEEVVRSKNDVEHGLECVREQLQTLTESGRRSVIILRSSAPRRSMAWKVRIRRPFLRWAAVFTVLVAVNLLGIAMVSVPDRPSRIASAAAANLHEPPATVPLLPSTASDFAMFDMPAGRAYATTGTIAATKPPSVERRDRPRETPAVPANGAARARSSKELVLYVGALTVDSEPAGSAVFVDREFVGETPLELTGLRVGSRVVRVERDGYDRWTTAVLVAADKQTRVSARLQALRDR